MVTGDTALLDEIATVCGHLNAQHARLVELVARAIETGLCGGDSTHTVTQWVAWRTGLSPARAAEVVLLARRRTELPVTTERFAAGELSVDQAAVVARRAPDWADEQAADLATRAGVAQLRRVLVPQAFSGDAPPPPEAPAETPSTPTRLAPGRCVAAPDDDGRFRLVADGPLDEGALIDAALREARDRLFRDGTKDVTDWDALVEVARRSLDGVDDPARRDRFRVHLHVDADARRPAAAPTVGGWSLPTELRQLATCDGSLVPWLERNGQPVSVGRARRIVPERTRRAVLRRDGGCRVPGCSHDRWLEIHHVIHWEHGGTTDTWNLVALCPRHHRLHHLGRLDIEGDADAPDGLRFHVTSRWAERLRHGPTVDPPDRPPDAPATGYTNPFHGTIDPGCLHFARPPNSTPGS